VDLPYYPSKLYNTPMAILTDDRRYLKYDGKFLYLKVNGQVRNLGLVTTLKGKLTRAQKLKAVAHTGQWIEL